MGTARDSSQVPDVNQRGSHQQTVPVEEDINLFDDHLPNQHDLPPSYAEASSSQAHNTATPSSPAGPTQPPVCPHRSCSSSRENTVGYKPERVMSMNSDNAKWEEMRDKPGCCFSDSGGCCFSSRGGCCFSDRGGCCFSDREGCCFSDRAGCCFSTGNGCC